MVTNTRGIGDHDAPFTLKGVISNGASWIASYRFQVGGAPLTDAEDFTWQWNLRDECNTVVLSASTDDSTLTVENDDDNTTLSVNVPYASLSALVGDYVADIVYQNDDGDRVHWAHGMMTVRDEPLWS